mgnify:CR=1 FL=1
MDIVSKSIFTVLDYSMDSFKIELRIREKYLAHLCSFFDVEESVVKKWSQVGKGLDYYTFKTWISKENRFTSSEQKYPKNPLRTEHYYHLIDDVLDKLNENSYEKQLKFYEALCLLSLVDKKKHTIRLEFLEWVENCLMLDREDCLIIREEVLIDYQLDFRDHDLSSLKKQSIFLQGVKLAFISDNLIDSKEQKFLKELSTRLDIKVNEYDYTNYLNYLGKNILHEQSGLNKVAAFLLHFIGCDENIHESEVKWFKDFFGTIDMNEIKPLMNGDNSRLLNSMDKDMLCLTYLLALEVSLADSEIHANERFWLEEIQSLLGNDYEVNRELYCIYLSVVSAHLSFVKNYPSYFKFIETKVTFDAYSEFKNWSLSQILLGKRIATAYLTKELFNKEFKIDQDDKLNFLIRFSSTILEFKHNAGLVENFKNISAQVFKDHLEDYYSELLICELLKISLIDEEIEEAEEDFLRNLQYKFEIDEHAFSRVIFYTSFLLGKRITLRERLNYSHI